MAEIKQMRVRTPELRCGDDGQTICTVLPGTEGTIIATYVLPRVGMPSRALRGLLLTVSWDACLLNQEDPADTCVATNWEEADVPQASVVFVGLVDSDGGRRG